MFNSIEKRSQTEKEKNITTRSISFPVTMDTDDMKEKKKIFCFAFTILKRRTNKIGINGIFGASWKTMHLRQRPTNKWFFEGKTWKFAIASACSTPPTSFVLPSMFNQRVCSDTQLESMLRTKSIEINWLPTVVVQCKSRSLSLLWCVYMLFSRMEWIAQCFTCTHSHKYTCIQWNVVVVLSSYRWKILCASTMGEIERKKCWKRRKSKHRKIIGYTWDDAYIYDM